MKKIYLYIILAAALTAGLRADSVDSLIIMAYNQNPAMQMARAALITAKQNERYAGAWENPELSLHLKDDAAGNGEGEGSFEIELTQDFSLSSSSKKEKALSEARSNLAKANFLELAQKIAQQVELLVIDLNENKENLLLQNSFTNLYSNALKFLNEQVNRGEASALDLTQLTLSKAGVDQQITRLKNRQKNILLKLKLLLNTSDDIDPDFQFSLDKKVEATPVTGLTDLSENPQHLVELATGREAEKRLALAEANRWDNVSLHLFGEQEKSSDQNDELEENTLLGVGLSIKLPFWKQNKANILKARSAQDLSEKRRAMLSETLKLSIINARENVKYSHELALQSNGEFLTLAEQNYQDYQNAYLKGQTSLVQVQRAREQQLEFKNKAIESLVNYYKAKAKLRYLLNDYPTLQLPE